MENTACERHEKELSILNTDITLLKISLAEIRTDTQYIKTKIDNGLLKSIIELEKNVTALTHCIKENSYWIDKVKWGTAMITIVAVGGGLVAVVIKMISG